MSINAQRQTLALTLLAKVKFWEPARVSDAEGAVEGWPVGQDRWSILLDGKEICFWDHETDTMSVFRLSHSGPDKDETLLEAAH